MSASICSSFQLGLHTMRNDHGIVGTAEGALAVATQIQVDGMSSGPLKKCVPGALPVRVIKLLSSSLDPKASGFKAFGS